MKWNGAIITDSGGYQVFSLAKLRKITKRCSILAPQLTDKIFLDLKNINWTSRKI